VDRHPAQANFYIAKESFAELIGDGLWKQNDLPPEVWARVKGHFGHEDTLALLASGVEPIPTDPPPGAPVGGMCWARFEPRPKPGELPINVYHYVIGHRDEHGYPVHGPHHTRACAPHHCELPDLVAGLTPQSETER
jgi:hypothetical protein